MKISRLLLVTYWCVINRLEVTKCATINDTSVLLTDLLTGYNKRVRPISEQDKSVNVSVGLMLKSIQELDEIRGVFTFCAALHLTWIDANMVWHPPSYGGIKSIYTSNEDVWVPELILSSPAEEVEALGKKWQKVKFSRSGLADWYPADMFKSTCAVDMKYYPFDIQICTVSYVVVVYSANEVTLVPPDDVELAYYDGNSVWTLQKIIIEGHGSSVDFLFYLKRKSGFIIVNVVLPLTFLSLLNAFVFLLVPESGERMSYCITVLLSIAVFMTIVSDTLPRSSEPVPSISYKLLFDLINSALITLTTIFNLRLYNKKDKTKVPRSLQNLYLILTCTHQNSKITPAYSEDEHFQEKIDQLVEKRDEEAKLGNNQIQEKQVDKAMADDVKISWEQISFMVDCFAFVTIAFLSVLSFIAFMLSAQ